MWTTQRCLLMINKSSLPIEIKARSKCTTSWEALVNVTAPSQARTRKTWWTFNRWTCTPPRRAAPTTPHILDLVQVSTNATEMKLWTRRWKNLISSNILVSPSQNWILRAIDRTKPCIPVMTGISRLIWRGSGVLINEKSKTRIK